MKKNIKIIFSVLFIFLCALYLGIVFLLPQIINCKITTNLLQSLILKKIGAQTNITGLNIKISPTLVAILNIDSIDAKNNNVLVVDIKNFALNYKLLQKRLTLVSADNIFIDGNYLKQFKKERKKKDRKRTELSDIAEIHIQKFAFKSSEVSANLENINSDGSRINLKAAVNTPFLKETLKFGDSGFLQITENKLKANKFKITLGNSHLYADGILVDKNNLRNIDIIGEKLPVSEVMPALLHFQKSKDPSKKFIENFKNYKGTLNLNLKLNKGGIWGTCIVNDLSANALWFNIPLYAKEVVFNFRGKTVDSVADGIIGNEKVVHTLNITEIGTPEKLVVGTLNAPLTKKFNAVPNLTVLNSANFKLVYKIKDRKPDVYYSIDIPAQSDLIFNSFYLGLRDFNRRIYANTLKDGNDLYLKEYKYSYADSKKENIVLSGDGLFVKNIDKNNPDKFIAQYLTVRTNGFAPISVTGSFGEKIKGGEFKGDLKYDFKNNQVLGTFDIIKARHKAFRIDQAHVVSKNGVFNITSNGLFKGENYSAELKLRNNIYGDILIYDMKMFLDKLIFETNSDIHKKNKKINPHAITKKVKDIAITINNWEIVINEIRRDKFILNNVKLLGSMKNNIFDFKMKELNFADGTINASGIYNFANNSSKIVFEAENINSNKVAQMTLNLKDQIEGIASTRVYLSAKDMFRFLDAYCTFEVKEGFLPKLGDTEFAIKNSKYKLSQIINIDLTQKDLMKDDIKGTFSVHNTAIKNINITTWHQLSAMYLEGNYEMEKQLADLQLFWKYSKIAPKGVKVFGIPLGFILKVVFRPENSKETYKSQLSKIPNINSDEKNTNFYRIHLDGDINNNKINLKLKEVR